MRSRLLVLVFCSTAVVAAGPSRVEMHLRVRFEKNLGQAEPSVQFIAREPRYTLLLSKNGVGMRPAGQSPVSVMRFAGASANARIEALDPLPTKVNDYTGGPRNWVQGAPCWSRVAYRGLYPGVDLIFYGQADNPEYDVRVSPGFDPSQVRFAFEESMRPAITPEGDLTIASPEGKIVWHKPIAYQTANGKREPVDASFVMQGRQVAFRVGAAWNRKYPLVIDPSISFSTYLGGGGSDGVRAVAADPSGNVYIAGGTTSGNLPVTASSFQSTYKSQQSYYGGNAFVAKLNATGTALAYITYLGGTAADSATGIAVDGAGNAYVAGFTNSPDFPVTKGAYQTHLAGGGGNGGFEEIGDAFVAKFSATGGLTWCTYVGGSDDDGATSIALDASGNIVIAGATVSPNFPGTSGGYQSRYAGQGGEPIGTTTGYIAFNTGDGFVAKIDPTGSFLLNATFLGGSLNDLASSLAIDSKGNVWVGGFTISSNFPVTPNAFQKTFGGQSNDSTQLIFQWGDGFVTELSGDLATLLYSTYLGGSRDDLVSAIAVDSSGAVYVAGTTESSNFPVTKGVISGTYNGPAQPPGIRPYLIGDAFVAKFSAGATSLVFSTYLGGSDDDGVAAMAVDSQGNIFVAGMTNSANFPTTSDATQAKFNGSGSGLFSGIGDGFLARINGTGTSLLYSTFLGGSSGDAVLGMAQDAAGNIYTAGISASPNFPFTTGVLQPKLNTQTAGSTDAVISKFAFGSPGPAVGGVVNGASFKTGPVSPGETIAIFGTGMGPATPAGAQIDASGKLSGNVAGVQVLFGSTPAPLVFVSAGQINAIVPYEVLGQTSTTFTVVYNGTSSAPVPLQVTAASPALFTANAQGTGQAAIYNQGFTPNSSTNPAARGSIITLFGTGEGQLSPAGITGDIVPLNGPYPTIAGHPSVSIGGVSTSTLAYSGSIPGFVEGTFQINVQVLSGVPSGNQPILVTVGGEPSPTGVTVWIQ